MDHHKAKHYTTIIAILGLSVFGWVYLEMVSNPEPTVIITIVAAIAGLGGYEVRKRANGG